MQAKAGRALPFGLAYDPGWPDRPRPTEHTRLVGQLSVSGIVEGSARSAAIGYWIDRQYAGRGIVPTAVALACDYCWQVMRLHRIEICIRPENGRSLRVVEKLGFREEGMRPRFLHINGDGATAGCVSVSKSFMIDIVHAVDSGDLISIKA